MFEYWRDFLGTISGYKQLYEQCCTESDICWQRVSGLEQELAGAKEVIRQLELLVPRPIPPKINLIAQKDTAWIQQVLDSMNLGIVRLPLDGKYYLTNQTNFLNIVAWDWTDTLPWILDKFDCDKRAMYFKVIVALHFGLNQVAVIIDYKSGHAYNLIFYPDGNTSVLEPQNDSLYVWTKRPQQFYSMQGAFAII